MENGKCEELTSRRFSVCHLPFAICHLPSETCTEAHGVKPLTIHQVRAAEGCKALSALPKNAPPVKSVFSDSNLVEPFSLFIAIKGANHDGHAYLPDAAAQGAVAALVSEPPRQSMPNLHLIGVDDTRKAMGK